MKPITEALSTLDGSAENIQDSVKVLLAKAQQLRDLADDIEWQAERIRDQSGYIMLAEEQLGYRKDR
jgi:hypothetical protein